MCGRFTQADPARIGREFSVTGQPIRLGPSDARPRYNVAPGALVTVVRVLDVASGRKLDALRWGLVPSWAGDPTIGNRMINARVETLAEKSAFRDALRLRRCLVVADGFYEWRGQRDKVKQPFYVQRTDGALLAMAGLWDRWTSQDGEVIESFTIVTKPSVPPVTDIHDRMPAILAEPHHDVWLDPALRDPLRLMTVLGAQSPDLSAFPVSTFVNKPANDGPECIEPVAVTGDLFASTAPHARRGR